jgi:hypothetical protein
VIIFLNLSFLNKLGMKLLMVILVRYIVLLNNIVSFSQHHRILAYPYNVHIQNNHHDNMVHIVCTYWKFLYSKNKEKKKSFLPNTFMTIFCSRYFICTCWIMLLCRCWWGCCCTILISSICMMIIINIMLLLLCCIIVS